MTSPENNFSSDVANSKHATASLKSKPSVQACEQVGLMIDSHLRLDEAISTQLKGVVDETESAAMMLIVRVRNISDAVNMLMTKLSGYEDMRQHNKVLFDEVGSYSASLAVDIAEIFGLLQFQDVVRQRIERVEIAVAQRNALFQDIAQAIDDPDARLVDLQVEMRAVLDKYLAMEMLHAPAFNNASTQSASVTKIELF